MIHAPDVTLAGKSISREQVLPDVPFLSPIGWQWPDGPLYLFAGSIAASSREFSSSTTMQCTHSNFLESVVLGFEDLSIFSLGWMVYDGQISLSSCPFVTSDLVAILDSISAQFFCELSSTQHGICIPKLFPLLARSGLADCQLYDPALGALDFVNEVLEQALGTSPKVHTCLQWMRRALWHLSIIGHVGQSLMWLFPDHRALLPLLSLLE
jgi:hypothetical protein